MRIGLILLTLLVGGFSPLARGAGKAHHVVVIVWDGMRPDFITETNTPTLYRLAHDGVWFDNHHPVYISSTEVNARQPSQPEIILVMTGWWRTRISSPILTP